MRLKFEYIAQKQTNKTTKIFYSSAKAVFKFVYHVILQGVLFNMYFFPKNCDTT